MGTVVKMRCVRCSYEQKLHLGGGLRDCKLETLLNVLPPYEQQKLNKRLCESSALLIERKAALCPDCREWFSLPVVKCVLKTQTEFYYGVCPTCSRPGESCLPDDLKKICPKCGEPILMSQIGLWD